ncbi:MAG TPA: hypothetical protein PKA64_03480 [Myxococcota bacterium]|nr:hypothetical protein [Myxococcota bacterium]
MLEILRDRALRCAHASARTREHEQRYSLPASVYACVGALYPGRRAALILCASTEGDGVHATLGDTGYLKKRECSPEEHRQRSLPWPQWREWFHYALSLLDEGLKEYQALTRTDRWQERVVEVRFPGDLELLPDHIEAVLLSDAPNLELTELLDDLEEAGVRVLRLDPVRLNVLPDVVARHILAWERSDDR